SPVVHAGLQHTYGYLFATLDTPYGPKRERWLSNHLERGFSLDPTLFSERPKLGTLLANITWFLGAIALRDRPGQRSRLNADAAGVAPELIGYDYARLSVERIIEQVRSPGPHRSVVTLITDLVPFLVRPDGDNVDTLLVYSVESGQRATRRIITA